MIVVWISETKLDDFYHSRFSDKGLHIHNVSSDMSFGLLQVFVKFGSQHEPRPLFSPQESLDLILLTTTEYKC